MTRNPFANSLLILQVNTHNPIVKVLLPLAGIIVVLLLARHKYHYSNAKDLKLRSPQTTHLLFWVCAALIWMLGTDYFMNWRGKFNLAPWSAQPLYVSVLRVLAVCFLGPILEELIFRGLFFQRLVRKVNPWLAVVMLAAAWGLLHYSYPPSVIAIIVGDGILLGAALLMSNSLYVPIAMHICWNVYAIW
jgi:membrane protease YdiL (CAAX protease family)